MPTQEEIMEAYEIVFNSEKEVAEDYLSLLEAFTGSLDDLASKIPSTNGNSVVLQIINQSKSALSMYPGTPGILQNAYQIGQAPAPTDGNTTVADSTV